MREIGYQRAFVVHGMNEDGTEGMDEVSTIGETIVAELHEEGEITTYTVTPEEFGMQRTDARALLPASNINEEALCFLKILSGMEQGPKADIVCLNAAPILYLMGKARNLSEGVEIARKTLESGEAIAKLKEWEREQNSDTEQGDEKSIELMHNETWRSPFTFKAERAGENQKLEFLLYKKTLLEKAFTNLLRD